MTKYEQQMNAIEDMIAEAQRRIELLRRCTFNGEYKPTDEGHNFERISRIVCNYYDQDIERVVNPIRGKKQKGRTQVSTARQIIFYLMRKHTNLTWFEIGKLCNRDHASALYGSRKIEDHLRFNKEIREQVERIESEIELDALKNCPILEETI